MKKRGRKKISYRRSIVVGFAVLYVTCMLFSTYLVKENYEAAYKTEMTNKLTALHEAIYNPYFPKFNEDGSLNENYIQEVTHAMSAGLEDGDKYNQFNMALYGRDRKIVAKTTEFFGQTHLTYDEEKTSYVYPDAMAVRSPYDYFTEEEMELILSYLSAEYDARKTENGLRDSYELSFKYNKNTGNPLWLQISKYQMKTEQIVLENGAETTLFSTMGDGEMLWTWQNPTLENPLLEINQAITTRGSSGSIVGEFTFPYLASGRKYYDAWKNDELLQSFDVEEAVKNASYYSSTKKKDANHVSAIYALDLENEDRISSHDNVIYVTDGTPNFALQINMASYPWHAAIDYMKYVYLFGAVLMFVCMMKVLYTTKKAYEKQEEVEQMRRDFTNAAAHELKTPLAIVRGLAETMEETTLEEKKSEYRKKIVEQTEVMDGLVKEMIFISKMDSKDLILKKEVLSVSKMMEEQQKKLETLIEEKNLQVEYRKEEDFVIQGDWLYLEKAFFNLLENAVAYNMRNGKIIVRVEKASCSIENTAEPIPAEDLEHVCDLFFTSNKSRQADSGHKGLGLYLVKRILDLHQMEMKIENTENGVKVTVK